MKFSILVTFPIGIILSGRKKSHNPLLYRQARCAARVGRAFHVLPCLLLPPAVVAVVLVVVRPVALVWVAVLAALCVVVFSWTVVLAVVCPVALVWAAVLAVVVLARVLVLATGLMLALTVVLAPRVRLMVTLGAAYLSKQKQLMWLFFPPYKQNLGSGEEST